MDELFSLLPAILIFFFIFKRISGVFEKIVEKNEEMSGEEIIYDDPPFVFEEKPKTEDINTKDDISKKNDKKNDKKNTEKARKKARKQIAVKKDSKGDLKNKNSIFPGNKLQQKDIVKGFVFKQILDEPRAKKPWKPANKE